MFFMKETKHNLPDELWLEVLSRLPVKSLLQFRCVSKCWRSMISDPKFCRQHLNNFENNFHEPHLFVAQKKGYEGKEYYVVRGSDTFKTTITLDSLDTMRLGGKWFVVCSMDGLVLLGTPTLELMLWNPSIRRTRTLPSSPLVNSVEGMKNIDWGFGFSSLVNDYKLVRLFRQCDDDLYSVAIYTFGADFWEIVDFCCKGISDWCWDIESPTPETVCFGGFLYLIGNRQDTYLDELVSFDLSNDVFASTIVPTAFGASSCELFCAGFTLVHGGSSLGLVFLNQDEGGIWVSESNAADIDLMQWTKLYVFNTCVPLFQGSKGVSHPVFLFLRKNGDLLLQWPSKWVTSCNLETGEKKRLQKKHRLHMSVVCGYIESMVLLNG